MSEETTTEPTGQAPDDETITTPMNQTTDAIEGDDKYHTASREAKYRIRARQAEKERDSLASMLVGTRRGMLESSASGLDPKAARDLFDSLGPDEINGLFDESGKIDGEKLGQFVSEQLKDKPYLAKRTSGAADIGDPSNVPETLKKTTWGDSFTNQ